MVLLTDGFEELSNQFKDLVDEGQWGTGTTTPAVSDSDLETATSGTDKTLITGSSGSTSQFTHELTSADGNGSDLTEYVLRFVNGDCLMHVVGGAISKNNTFDLTTLVNINFEAK